MYEMCNEVKLDGMSVVVTRVPLERGSQLSVFINTEELHDERDQDEGTPNIQVLLNDATLYDREPRR